MRPFIFALGGPVVRLLVTQPPKLRLANNEVEWGDNVALGGPRALPLRS